MSAPTQYGFEQARAQLPTLIAQAHAGQSSIITKHGKPYAAIVPLADLAQARKRTSKQGGMLKIGLHEIGQRLRVARLQQGLRIPAAANRFPVGPAWGFLHQPLQPRLHTPRDFLMQPG
jgi:prevent-host-death family protein